MFIDGGPDGFVAVATERTWRNIPVVSTTADGRSWEEVDASALPNATIGSLDGVAAGPGGYVIFGRSGGSGDVDFFAWFSADGRNQLMAADWNGNVYSWNGELPTV